MFNVSKLEIKILIPSGIYLGLVRGEAEEDTNVGYEY